LVDFKFAGTDHAAKATISPASTSAKAANDGRETAAGALIGG
jgi:hypothetical protein